MLDTPNKTAHTPLSPSSSTVVQGQNNTPFKARVSYAIRGTKVSMPYPTQLTPAETRLVFSLQKQFSPDHILADCFYAMPTRYTEILFNRESASSNAKLAQIDCLAVDQRGIFIFESKDYAGWIYGDAERKFWTQVLNFGRIKNQFYNPIYQNSAHLAAVKTIFEDPPCPLFSVIVFGQDSTLKTLSRLPQDCLVCTQNQLHQQLSTITAPAPLSPEQQKAVLDLLLASLTPPTPLIRAEHIAEVPHRSQ